MAGWGRTRVGGLNSPSLREVAIPMVPNDDCRTNYHKDKEFINHIFDNTVMCAGTKQGGRDSCQVSNEINKRFSCHDLLTTSIFHEIRATLGVH